ncbi:MAG: class I SAM-dependent methyltransferase [Gammaproteobacteria bacterium]|nr:class I SAM-dependent methyltransferase [Gammaproteobacteria bacterium]
MTIATTEEVLAAEWLALRRHFDDQARNPGLLQQLVDYAKTNALRCVADLGTGTGNHARFLQRHLRPHLDDIDLHLVEQHPQLLAMALSTVNPEEVHSAGTMRVHAHHCDMHRWLSSNRGDIPVDLVTHNALLDLLTQNELQGLVRYLANAQVAMYSTLNYQSVQLLPEHPQDTFIIALFEQHMCRNLDRGRPLGPSVDQSLRALLSDEQSLSLVAARSDWKAGTENREFISRNLDFYESGARATASSAAERASVTAWAAHRHSALHLGKLQLVVRHVDYLILPVDGS